MERWIDGAIADYCDLSHGIILAIKVNRYLSHPATTDEESSLWS